MGLVEATVWMQSDTQVRADLVGSEPRLRIMQNDWNPDVSIFLGAYGGSLNRVAAVEAQLGQWEAAIAEARRLWTERLAVEAKAADPEPGPDEPTDEPTDEPGIPVHAEPGSLAGRLLDLDR